MTLTMKNKGREKLSLVDWLRSKTPALAVEVNSDPEAKQFLEDNQVMMIIMVLMLMMMMIMMIMINIHSRVIIDFIEIKL